MFFTKRAAWSVWQTCADSGPIFRFALAAKPRFAARAVLDPGDAGAEALFDFSRGDAGVDAIGFHVAGSDGAEAEDGAFAGVDAGGDDGAGADPGVGLEAHGVGDESEFGVVVVVGGAADVGALGDDGVRAEEDGRGVVDLGVVGQRDAVFADQVPRGPDFTFGVEVSLGTHFGAEKLEKKLTPGVHGARRGAVEQHVDDGPELPGDAVAQGVDGGQAGVLGERGRCQG